MYKQVINLIIAAISFTACISPGRFPPTTPTSSKPETAPKATNPSARQWTFNFHNEAHTYSSTSQTILESDSSNSNSSRDTVSIAIRFTLAIDRSQMPISISGHIDSFVLKPGSRIGTDNQKTSIPIDFNGIIDSGQLVLNATTKSSSSTIQTENNSCNGLVNSLLGEVRGGIILIPVQLQPSSTWADTVSTVTCSGNTIPSSLEIIRSYQVIGETTSSNITALLIKRTEHIHLIGNGAQGQHRVKLEGEGTGSSDITLDFATGTILAVKIYHELRLTIISSGQTKHFTQSLKEQISLTP